MVHYKLTYFNVSGLAEPIRYLLSYMGTHFEDNRLQMVDFEKVKPTLPFGKVPVLEIDGKVVTQSAAICRYLGKQARLIGKTDLDALHIDEVVDTITDWRINYSAFVKSEDEKEKATLMAKIKAEHNPYYLGRLEEIAKANGGFLVNGQLTWADLYFSCLSEMFENLAQKSLLTKNYPTLKALREKVENLPTIKAYRIRRPETAF